MSLDKKELKGPDAFVSTSDKVFLWIERHAKTAALVAVAVAVVAVGWIVYGYVQAANERKAADALYGPEAALKKLEAPAGELGAKVPKKDAVDFAPAVEKVKVAIKEHAGTRAAVVSALNLSYFLLQQKKAGEALEVLALPSFQPSAKDMLGGFWLMHKGVLLTETQKFEEAQKAFQGVVESSALGVFHPEALLKLGIAQELKGDVEKARQTYQKIAREYPQSEASTSATQYLRLLEMKAQQG